eukprot:scaffold1658_cov393-Prasinococcus_capsulatus_cf.AAC.26
MRLDDKDDADDDDGEDDDAAHGAPLPRPGWNGAARSAGGALVGAGGRRGRSRASWFGPSLRVGWTIRTVSGGCGRRRPACLRSL